MLISGNTMDKNGNAVSGAVIEIKDSSFKTLYKALSDSKGTYSMELPDEKYAFLTAVRDYGERYLEYWCQNICPGQDIQLEIRFDMLEVYGLHVFEVKGAYPSLMVYFRPMSLEKYKNGDEDICPEIKSIHAFVNTREVSVLQQNKVVEYVGERTMGAFLIQIGLPEATCTWDRVDFEIWDTGDNYGMATIFAE